MLDCSITFRSITRAQRGEELLEQIGIRCRMQRTPAILAQQGCGYVLQVSAAQLREAVEALRQNGITFGRVYLMHDGAYQEMDV